MSLEDLVNSYIESGANLLAAHEWLMAECDRLGIVVVPDLRAGTATDVRLFRRYAPVAANPIGELERGEGTRQEFKSSLWYDHKRAANELNATLENLKSDGVAHAVLKSIAAFLNGEGGVLWIGVDDQGKPMGVHADLSLFGKGSDDLDGFELLLRSLVAGRFKDGTSIDGYIQVSFHSIDHCNVARVEVTRRRRLSYLKRSGGGEYELFVRNGNLTRSLRIDEVEEFLEKRRAD